MFDVGNMGHADEALQNNKNHYIALTITQRGAFKPARRLKAFGGYNPLASGNVRGLQSP